MKMSIPINVHLINDSGFQEVNLNDLNSTLTTYMQAVQNQETRGGG